MTPVTCEVCGVELQIGDFPLGCKGAPARHQPSHLSVVGDDIPGGHSPQHCPPLRGRTFYSKKAVADAAKAAGYENRVEHHGSELGSDKSPHTSRWI